MKIETWIDLAPVGLSLNLVKVPRQMFFFVVTGANAGVDVGDFADKLLAMGYQRHTTNKGIFVRVARFDGDKLSAPPRPEEWKRHFPEARVITFDEATNFKDRSEATAKTSEDARPPEAAPARPRSAPDGDGRLIGVNALGQDVFETGDGSRYAVDDRRAVLPESTGSRPGHFLRAVDDEALALCAQGLVEVAVRGRILRDDDFERFVATVGASSTEAARTAVQAAMVRHVARRGGKTIGEAFIASNKVAENLAFLSNGRGSSFRGPVAPVALAAQRILRLHTDSEDLVEVDGVGVGAFVTHLPRSAKVVVHDGRPELLAAARATGAAAGLRSFAVSDVPPSGAVSQLVDVPSGGDVLGRVTDALSRRSPDGVSVFVVDTPSDETSTREFEELRDRVAREFVFDGEAVVEPGLASGRHDGPGRTVLSVGLRRAKPSSDALPPDVRKISDWGVLWTWAADVVMQRARAAAVAKPASDGTDVAFNVGKADGNDYQTPYVSASRVGTPSTMVPRNLEGATRDALAKVAKRADGDVDGWVASEFGYSKEDLTRLFSPEQVDALGLYLLADERGRAFLIADQTGVGKGRTLAAIMRRDAIKGLSNLFVTERQQNLSDIWRDIVHTESTHLLRPFVLNDGVEIIDESTKEVVHRSAPREAVERTLSSGGWPEGHNLVLATYSQFSRAAEAGDVTDKTVKDLTSRKADWLVKAVGKDVRVKMDECHNAASSTSNVHANMTRVVKEADQVTYSSATYAKDAEHMAFYGPLMPKDMSTAELDSMMRKGGETFQEVLSGMLVHDGVMVRREFDLSKITYETIVDTARFERNLAYMDAFAPVIYEMVALTGEVDRVVRAANEGNRARQDEAGAQADAPVADAGRKTRPFHMSKIGFGSPLYTISRLFVAALKVDAVVDDAVAALKANKKPVIVVENTIQSLLEELAENEESVEGSVTPDFRALFHRTLRQMTTVRWTDGKSKMVRDLTDTDAALRARVDQVRRLVDSLPDLPVSAIDEVKRRIEETGFVCDEITGRTLEVRGGRIMRRAASNPTVVKNSFNSGDVDALVINVAGSTGIDLHASSRFGDKRKRRLVELQAPADVLRKIQSHGRVNRFDQVEDPEIVSVLSGLPIELRLCAMENAKLRRLSANTTSNRDAAILTRDIPDLINPIGDQVCSRYAEVRPDLMRRLGFKVEDVQQRGLSNETVEAQAQASLKADLSGMGKAVDGGVEPKAGTARKTKAHDAFKVQDSKRSANEILARLIMLPVDMQTRVCNELTAEFHAAVEELEAKGDTPLKTHELPGIVHVKERSVFEGADVENPDSVFHEPLYSLKGAVQRTGTAVRSDDLMQRIEIGQMGAGRAQGCIDRLRMNADSILEPFLPHGCNTVAEALAAEAARTAGRKEVTERKAALERLGLTLADLVPGKQVSFTLDGVLAKGIVTRVVYPDRGYEHVAHSYGVEFVVPGDEHPRRMRLQALMRDPSYAVSDGLEGDAFDAILASYDHASTVKLTNVNILTHNIYHAMRLNVEHGLGRLMTYQLADGTRHRGVVVSKGQRDLKSVPIEVPSSEMALDAIRDGNVELLGSPSVMDKTFSIRRVQEGTEFRLPKRNSKMGFIYDDPLLQGLLRRDVNTTKTGNPRIVVNSDDEVRDVVKALYGAGARFWCPPVKREWAIKWLSERHVGNEPYEAPSPVSGMAMA